MKFYFHQPNIIGDVDLDHPAEVVCQFLPPTVTLFSHLSILHSLESCHCEQPTLRKQGVTLYLLLGWSTYTNYLGLFCMGDMCFLPIYLINHLFILVWSHGYLLHTLDYNSVLLYIFYSNCSTSGHWKLFQFTFLLLLHTTIFVIPVLFLGCAGSSPTRWNLCLFAVGAWSHNHWIIRK